MRTSFAAAPGRAVLAVVASFFTVCAPVFAQSSPDCIEAVRPLAIAGPDHSIGFGWRGPIRPRPRAGAVENFSSAHTEETMIGFGRVSGPRRHFAGRGYGAKPMRVRVARFGR